MNFTVVFSISHSEENGYHKIYEILDKEYNLRHFEMQGDRKVLTPHTTVFGESHNFKSSKELAESIIDRFQKEDITLDRILVTKGNDFSLIG